DSSLVPFGHRSILCRSTSGSEHDAGFPKVTCSSATFFEGRALHLSASYVSWVVDTKRMDSWLIARLPSLQSSRDQELRKRSARVVAILPGSRNRAPAPARRAPRGCPASPPC